MLSVQECGYSPDGPAEAATVNHCVLCDMDDSCAAWDLTARPEC